MSLKVEYTRGLPELLKFRKDPTAYVGDLGRRSVDVWNFRAGWRNLFLVNNPELIQNVLVTHDWNFIKGRGLRNSKPMLGEGLLTSEGELHRRQRRLAQPGFHGARLAHYCDQIVSCTSDLIEEWKHGPDFVTSEEMMRLTLRIVGLTLFSADVTKESASVGASLTEALRVFIRLNHPLVQMVGPLRRMNERRAVEARRGIEVVLLEIIEKHRLQPKAFDDMLSLLMSSHDEMGTSYMSNGLLLDECLTIFLAGHETTANALSWTWYLLSLNPDAQVKLHEELAAVLGGRLPSIDDMQRLPFTTAVVRESLRLFPPAWVISREAVTPYRLEEIEVPATANLILSPFATHRDPRFWTEPESFRPERWMDGSPDNGAASRPRFAYFPFGAGTRVCIGENFAMMEAVMVVASIAQHFRLSLLPGQKVELWPQITLRSRHPLSFKLERRHI
ncbi:cytochrome P450 [Edaphobacter modestus]|uniref:Cytochrome P450 n=1 Tax=Edaphobacter modestus TaxID=388466 RepID=A0A4Q7YVE6_9BACT|nr:cytochrome P450 [Edaphobacter modestus]RZU41767.1 cytochrome P450 [Edaphobacter modestus]